MPLPPRTRRAAPGATPDGPDPAPAALHASRLAAPPPQEPDDEELDREDDEGAIELPPLDADDEPEQDEEGDPADLLDPLDSPDNPLDDAAAHELETGVDVDLDDDEAQGGDESAEDEVDVGPLEEDLVLGDGERWDEEAEGERDHDDDAIDEERANEDDGGAEGTGDDPEDDVDEGALPALDADEEGAYEGEDLLAELPDLPDDRPPAWDASPWAPVEGAGAAAPCCVLAVAGGLVVAAGAGKARRAERAAGAERGVVLLVDPGAHGARRAGVDAAASSVAISDGAVVVATRRGHLLRSDDGGATTSALGAWGRDKTAPVTLATTPGRLWILSEGTLWSLPLDAAPVPPAVARERDVLRIAASGGTLVALTSTPAGPRIERLRGDDEGAPSVPLEGAAREAAQAGDGQFSTTAGGQAIALSGESALCVSRDGGATFRVIAGLPPVLALAFAGDGEGAPLLALVAREGEAGAQLVQVLASTTTTVVAEVGVEPASGGRGAAAAEAPVPLGPAAIAWDSSREVAWVASRAGLIALARTRTH